MNNAAIVWFRRDLRLEDNPALDAALRTHARVLCAYIHAPDEEDEWAPGAASRWWLHHSLAALARDLRRRGAELHIRSGSSLEVLEDLVGQTGAQAVYWNRLYEPALIAREAQIGQGLRARGVVAESFNANLLIEPWEIQTGQGGPYRVFTPYWRKARAQIEPRPPIPAPKRIASLGARGGVMLDALALLPKVAWDRGLRNAWKPGEQGAHDALRRFCADALTDYAQGRDRPDREGTSRLSAHLHFGEIGPRQIAWELLGQPASGRMRAAAEPFMRELGWRDFSHQLLHHFPQTPQQNLNPQFDTFPWLQGDAEAIARWQRGETGVPIVDAGMRQLWKSGWMHNRVRMIVASFLTKNLRRHWLHGARWFWDTLVDADLANNTQGWQWTAGSGADAAPYFRIFNPVSQGERFDPDGAYVRRWVPELQGVPAPLVHQPWKDADLLRRIGYPAPMVDLRESREAALVAYRQMRANPELSLTLSTPGRLDV
ncbi:MAG: deoxyribodipyrimidine photo-lyase [Rudaea sp.]|nr:deoxyribodipyrimidine photo-lyase [Rudaea sp.]